MPDESTEGQKVTRNASHAITEPIPPVASESQPSDSVAASRKETICQQAIKAGWLSYQQDLRYRHADLHLQKRVRNDQRQTLYFINLHEYFGRLPNEEGIVVMASATFYCDGDQLELELGEVRSLEHAEQFYAHAWRSLGCDIDQHNND